MAFADFRGNTAQFNQTMRSILPFLMNQGLMRQRQGANIALEDQRQAGRLELEGVRSGNRRQELEDAFIFTISQAPQMENLISRIQLGESRGEDMTKDRDFFTKVTKDVARASLASVKGDENIPPEDVESMLANLSESASTRLLGELGAGIRQERGLVEQRAQRGLQRERFEEVEKPTARLREKEFMLDTINLNDKDMDRWIKVVDRAEDFLTGEGVRPEKMTTLDFNQMLKDMGMAGGGGEAKLRDPLTPELRGKSFQWLGEIKQKLLNRQPISEADRRFLTMVRNSSLIQEEGGLISKETGRTGSEEEAINQRLIEAKAQEIMSLTGISHEQALIEAVEYVKLLK